MSAVKNAAELSPWCLAKLAESLPEGTYKLAEGEPGIAALGWLLAQHRFDVYRSKKDEPERGARVLLTGEAARIDETVRLARGDRAGPRPRQHAGRRSRPGRARSRPRATRRKRSGAASSRHHGRRARRRLSADRRGRPRARSPERAPRLIELEWGNPEHPRVAIVGKGVCFDSGGLDIKPAGGMRLMKKDMGGAAHALGARPADHGRAAAGPPASADPGGRECRLRRRLSARRHRQVAQGPDRRDRQYRRRRPAGPRRRADQARSRTSPS